MPSVYYSRFLGDGWSAWEGGHFLPPMPTEFDQDAEVSLASRDGEDRCYVYSPEREEVKWCVWKGDRWSEWLGTAHLSPPPNYIVDEQEAFFSVSSHRLGEWVIAYNPADGRVYWSPWTGRGYGPWEGPNILQEEPPNLNESADVFAAGDGKTEWLVCVNTDDWSVYYASLEEDGYSEWKEAPALPVPEEWVEMGLDLDGDGRSGTFWVYATVYNDE
ncbi:hypothetical protein L6R29_18820 [Myxococcota bacterium]|nr:hypothetical protein [Myxococcota bacterium]